MLKAHLRKLPIAISQLCWVLSCAEPTRPVQSDAATLAPEDASRNVGDWDASAAEAGGQDRSSDAGSSVVCAADERAFTEPGPERETPTAAFAEDDYDLEYLDELQLGLASYVLDVAPDELRTFVSLMDFAEHGRWGQATARALSLSRADAGPPAAVDELRRLLHAKEACADYPPTLNALKAQWGDFERGEQRTIDDSQVAPFERVIYEYPERGLFAAQALTQDGNVLETEVIRRGRRTDGALDFLVYDESGKRQDSAKLFLSGQTAVLPSPYACMLCHRSFGTPRFDIVNPAGGN